MTDRPLKVLHVYRTWFPDTQGGLEEAIRQIALATRAHGIESRVFTLSQTADPERTEVDGIPVRRVRKSFEIASCGVALGGVRPFREEAAGADVVHYHHPWPFADLLHLAARHGRASVLTYHSDIVRQRLLEPFYAPMRRRFLASMDAVVATSGAYAATSPVLQRLGERVRIIPLGLAETPPADPARTAALRAVHGDGFAFFVGVLRAYKGLDVLLEAARGADIRVLIAGDGPMGPRLEGRARALGLTNVAFLGRIGDVDKRALMSLAATVVLPSHLRSEAFGISLVEGAMAGRALVSTALGTGTSFVNIDGETGIEVPPGDADALRAALTRLCRDKALAERMGRAARARYRAHFDGEALGHAYSALYRELARSRSDRSPL